MPTEFRAVIWRVFPDLQAELCAPFVFCLDSSYFFAEKMAMIREGRLQEPYLQCLRGLTVPRVVSRVRDGIESKMLSVSNRDGLLGAPSPNVWFRVMVSLIFPFPGATNCRLSRHRCLCIMFPVLVTAAWFFTRISSELISAGYLGEIRLLPGRGGP